MPSQPSPTHDGGAPAPGDVSPEPGVFRALFGAYPDALLLVDPSGHILMGNAMAASMLGYSVDELATLNVDELVPDSIRPSHAAHRRRYAAAPRPRPMGLQMDLVARRKDGSEVTVEIALSPLQGQGLPLVVVAIRDVGAYPRVIQAQRRARYSEQLARLGRLAVDSRDTRALLDEAPRVAADALQVDEATLALLDSSQARLRVVASHSPPAHLDPGTEVSNQPDTAPGYVIAAGRPVLVEDFGSEKRFVVPPAYLQAGLVSGMAVPLFDRGRAVGTLSVRTRQARHFGADEVHFLESLANLLAASMQRQRSEEALNHAQRLESVGQLTGGIAHDFNNLLTVIQGNLQVLEELPALAQEGQAQQLLAAAARASKRGADLTGKLLAFSRRQVLKPAAVDVGALLHSLADMLRRTLDQRIGIEVQVPAQPLAVLADPGQLEAALLNIAINARDAMPEGGSLRFSAAPCAALPAEARRDLDDASAVDDGFVAIAVADSGAGMSEAVKARAFEPFFTTKEAGRGTGLGLSTVYGFAKQSRGAVLIDSAVGMGTKVALYIPRPWALDEPTEVSSTSLEVPQGLQVLLVEDDPEVSKIARNFLEAMGCRVTQAASAELALPLLQPAAGLDLLLSDIALGPGMRGTELAVQAAAHLPQLRVLLMSGYSAELLEADRDCPPSWELLRKPFTRQELEQAIARALQ